MDKNQLDDLKQFIVVTVSQTEDRLERKVSAELGREIASLQKEFTSEIADLRRELSDEAKNLHGEIRSLRSELSGKLTNLRSELIDLRDELNDLRSEMHDGFAGVGDAIEIIHGMFEQHEAKTAKQFVKLRNG